jgi:hypothetical protein
MTRNRPWSRFLTVAAIAALVLPAATAAGGFGKSRRAPTIRLVGEATATSLAVQMISDYDPILFQLTSFRGRYKVLRIDLINTGQKTLVLSVASDRLVALISGSAVPAILDLGAGDPGAWDSLADEMRRNLAYPAKVDPGEEATVFAYLKDVPPNAVVTELRYSLASLPAAPITLRKPAATAR